MEMRNITRNHNKLRRQRQREGCHRLGVDFDSERMTKDLGYAYDTLMELGNTEDQMQGLVVMQALKHLGLLDLSDGMSE